MEMRNLSKYQKLSGVVTQTQNRPPHTCHRTVGWRRWLRLVSEWYLLYLYALFYVVFAFGMWKGLHGRPFAVSGRYANKSFRLTQTDVSTIISACLVAGRAIGAAWQGLAAWRCIFILFEKNGLSLADANVVGSWKLPPSSIIRRRPSSRPDGGATKLLAILSLLLAWPAQLASPLATGSISWVPTSSYDINSEKNLSLGLALPSRGWGMYKNGRNIRSNLSKWAAGLANLKATAPFEYNNGSLSVTQSRRMATFLGSYTNGTVVQNATVPMFKIESFEWVNDESQIPPKILEAVKDPKSGYLNFAKQEALMTNAVWATTLLKDQPWTVPSTDTLPDAIEVLHEMRYAAIYLFSGSKAPQYECHNDIDNNDFSPLPPGIHLVINRRPDRSDCLAVAKLRISVGTTECNQADPKSPTPSCIIASNIMISTSGEVFPDSLTREIFAMMQEVHTVVASLWMNDPETYAGKLEQAMRDNLVLTYQGIWSTLTEYFSLTNSEDEVGRLNTRVWEPVQALRAEISPARILLWLAMSMLFEFSGFLVLVLDNRSEGKTVIDPVVEAIRLDSSRIIPENDSRLGNVVDADKRLRLEFSCRSGVEGDKCHPILVPERGPVM